MCGGYIPSSSYPHLPLLQGYLALDQQCVHLLLLVWTFQVAPELNLFTLAFLDPQDVACASNRAIFCVVFSSEV